MYYEASESIHRRESRMILGSDEGLCSSRIMVGGNFKIVVSAVPVYRIEVDISGHELDAPTWSRLSWFTITRPKPMFQVLRHDPPRTLAR